MLAVENRESCPDTTGGRPRRSLREDSAGAFLPGTFVAAFVCFLGVLLLCVTSWKPQ